MGDARLIGGAAANLCRREGQSPLVRYRRPMARTSVHDQKKTPQRRSGVRITAQLR